MARPKIKLDYELIKKLSYIQCTQEEIASFLEVSVDTLQRDSQFCGIYKKGQEHGKMSLRRLQWGLANKNNATMAIWLGKQYLGQTDKNEFDINIKATEIIISHVVEVINKYVPNENIRKQISEELYQINLN
ncbi:MAG: hypothetical protein M1308_24150 [Actinobacteria bacterium]|nr:hypothetical protein [Actinomycetota bacterium]